MVEHTSRAFEAELSVLNSKIAEMTDLAVQQITRAIAALKTRDTQLADSVIAIDDTIDALQREIEDRAILTIARRQPMAIDLREIIGALHVSIDLERIGDLAENIANRVRLLGEGFGPNNVLLGVEHIADLVIQQINEALDSYRRRDSDKAIKVWRSDVEVDAANDSLFRELLTYMMEDPRSITVCTHLLFCIKNIERMGDHATNIAESVYYMALGQTLPTARPKGGFEFPASAPDCRQQDSARMAAAEPGPPRSEFS